MRFWLDQLDEREQKSSSAASVWITVRKSPRLWKEVGAQLGVTKERIRQIEARALNKLRLAAQGEQIAIPE